jgi:hypothetical protein
MTSPCIALINVLRDAHMDGVLRWVGRPVAVEVHRNPFHDVDARPQ